MNCYHRASSIFEAFCHVSKMSQNLGMRCHRHNSSIFAVFCSYNALA